jgi:hypothetical protein
MHKIPQGQLVIHSMISLHIHVIGSLQVLSLPPSQSRRGVIRVFLGLIMYRPQDSSITETSSNVLIPRIPRVNTYIVNQLRWDESDIRTTPYFVHAFEYVLVSLYRSIQ